MRKYTLVFILLMLFGCQLVVDVHIPIEKQKLTLNSFFTIDSLWTAKLSLSKHILDNDPSYKTVDNALVIVYEQGNPIDTLHNTGNGTYRSDSGSPVHPGAYEIRAEAPGYGKVYSKSYIPESVAIESTGIEMSINADNQAELSAMLKFNDKANEKNYYQVIVIGETPWKNPQTGEESIQRFAVGLEHDNPTLGNDNIDAYGIFKDLKYDGQEIVLRFKGRFWSFSDPEEYKLTFYLRSLSEDYYQYQITSQLQNNTSGDPFAQPVSVYTNIENGFGIFGGFSQSVFVYEN